MEAKSPRYRRLVAKINPLIIGPSVWPMSMVVARNPMEAPTRVAGAMSHIMGEVEERTVAKETPYAIDKSSSRGNWVVKGNAATKTQLASIPTVMGLVLPILSETLPTSGLAITRATIWLPITIPIEKASSWATSPR